MYESYNIGTEEYILGQEKKMLDLEDKFDEKREQAISFMEAALQNKDKSSIKKLLDMFEDKELIEALCEDNEFAFMLVIMEIYNIEMADNVKNNVFYWADSLKGVIDIIRQIKFLLWEIEFLDDSESGQLLLGYMEEVNISMPAFEYVVYISSCNEEKIVERLSKLFARG